MPRRRNVPQPRYWCGIWDWDGAYRGMHRYSASVIAMLHRINGVTVIQVSHAEVD